MEVISRSSNDWFTAGIVYTARRYGSRSYTIVNNLGTKKIYNDLQHISEYFDIKGEPQHKVLETNKELHFLNNIVKENQMNKNQIKQTAVSIRNSIKPYEKYIVAAAILIAIDYFILKGAGSKTIKDIATRTFDKLSTVVNSGIDKLLGE